MSWVTGAISRRILSWNVQLKFPYYCLLSDQNNNERRPLNQVVLTVGNAPNLNHFTSWCKQWIRMIVHTTSGRDKPYQPCGAGSRSNDVIHDCCETDKHRLNRTRLKVKEWSQLWLWSSYVQCLSVNKYYFLLIVGWFMSINVGF